LRHGLGYSDNVKEAVQDSDTALSDLWTRVDELDAAQKRQEALSMLAIPMARSTLEMIEWLERQRQVVREGQLERERLREKSRASLERLHRTVRELKEAEPDGARRRRR
jgi:hypothetical protein